MPVLTPLSARPDVGTPGVPGPGPGLHRIPPAGHIESARAAWIHVPAAWRPDTAVPLAVMLHGSGGDPTHALGLLQPDAERAGAIVVAPASGGFTWDGVLGGIGPDWRGIDALLAWVFARYRVDARRIAIGGFSDGASYALCVGLGNGHLFTQVIALSPGFIPRGGQHGRPAVFVSHGTDDRVLPIGPCSRRIVPALQQGGYGVEYLEFTGGHEVPTEVAAAAVRWWLGAHEAGS